MTAARERLVNVAQAISVLSLIGTSGVFALAGMSMLIGRPPEVFLPWLSVVLPFLMAAIAAATAVVTIQRWRHLSEAPDRLARLDTLVVIGGCIAAVLVLGWSNEGWLPTLRVLFAGFIGGAAVSFIGLRVRGRVSREVQRR